MAFMSHDSFKFGNLIGVTRFPNMLSTTKKSDLIYQTIFCAGARDRHSFKSGHETSLSFDPRPLTLHMVQRSRIYYEEEGEGLGSRLHCLTSTLSLLQEFLQYQSDCRILHVTKIAHTFFGCRTERDWFALSSCWNSLLRSGLFPSKECARLSNPSYRQCGIG